MKILIVEPFYAGSHKQWMCGFKRHSRHEISFLTLPGRFWKWRMIGGAIPLAREFLKSDLNPDLLLCSDMLDLATFRALTGKRAAGVPAAVYFHENQASYPWSPGDSERRRGAEHHFVFRNFTTALCADAIFFNSNYNRNSFFDGVESLLAERPDFQERELSSQLRDTARVLPIGMDLRELIKISNPDSVLPFRKNPEYPLVVWNHRWEFDKNPGDFFQTLLHARQKGLVFELAVLGEQPGAVPGEFEKYRSEFSDEIVQWGYASDRARYASWLAAGDLLPVTSQQEFFGVSVLEAVSLGCVPLLPRRLSYPEIFSGQEWSPYFYSSIDELSEKLCAMLSSAGKGQNTPDISGFLQFDWLECIKVYDDCFEEVARAELKSPLLQTGPGFELPEHQTSRSQ